MSAKGENEALLSRRPDKASRTMPLVWHWLILGADGGAIYIHAKHASELANSPLKLTRSKGATK